ncbi:rhodanese-like domain-containing protein [Halomonas sp. Bachu 37]|uniref:rhodanese-like domain-containing protein n=1 Tax=Halomonas kashgarensis TaxID=3084920 RepID=UPI0032178326
MKNLLFSRRALSPLLLGGMAWAALASPGMADETAAYRETQLGLYLTASEAYDLLQEQDDALLIDVRDPIEIKFTGFAEPTDIHVPWMLADRDKFDEQARTWAMAANEDFARQIEAQLDMHGASDATPLIVMCRSGATRSAPAADVIADMGYTQVYSVSDGFEGGKLEEGNSAGVRARNGWRNSGLPWSYEIDPDVAWQGNDRP